MSDDISTPSGYESAVETALTSSELLVTDYQVHSQCTRIDWTICAVTSPSFKHHLIGTPRSQTNKAMDAGAVMQNVGVSVNGHVLLEATVGDERLFICSGCGWSQSHPEGDSEQQRLSEAYAFGELAADPCEENYNYTMEYDANGNLTMEVTTEVQTAVRSIEKQITVGSSDDS